MNPGLIPAIIFITLFTAAHVFGWNDTHTYFNLLSLAFLPVIYDFLRNRKRFFALYVAVSVLFFILRFDGYLRPSLMAFPIGLLLLAAVLISERSEWQARLNGALSLLLKTDSKLKALQKDLAEKKVMLRKAHLQQDEIMGLFQLAKNLNELLHFDAVLQALEARVFEKIPFEQLTLLVFANEMGSKDVIHRFNIQSGGHQESDKHHEDLSNLEKRIVRNCSESRQALCILERSDFPEGWPESDYVTYPFWIYPLIVEDQVIAVFLAEGVQKDAFKKLEVVVSQLALHVKRIKLYETVRELSILDGLTQVFVRRHFLERFEDELKRSIRYHFSMAVLMLDVDHFKRLNDKYGHLVGDATLKQVADVIKKSVRRVDIISRYGGEEFAIVLPETDKQGALEVAERIRSEVAHSHFKTYDEHTQVTVSIGVTCTPDDLPKEKIEQFHADLLLDLLGNADQALYHAKNDGRNQVALFRL